MPDADSNVLVAQILSSYLSNNTVATVDLPNVIESVKRAFNGEALKTDSSMSEEGAKIREPAVSIKKSVTPNAIACLCCGQSFKSLKRHLRTAHHLNPADYRAVFQLRSDYPIVAPNYAAKRSELAKSLGLGHRPKVVEAPKKRGPKKKADRAAAAA